MTIQRQYSLPNCKLVLEGWGEEPGSDDLMTHRPVMTMLVNAECHFAGQDRHFSGGREFLDSLVAAVSHYAQQVLSGVSHAGLSHRSRSLVNLEPTGSGHLHRLTVAQSLDEKGSEPASGSQPVQIDLSTVQLFDLVEAIDQMVADAQTLPDLTVDLSSVPRRQVVSEEPVAQRVLPAALGISGLAVAAIALFFVPPPEFRPAEETPTQDEQTLDTIPEGTAPGTAPDANDADATATPAATAVETEETEADVDASTEEPETSTDASVSAAETTAANRDDLPDQDEVEEFLSQAAPIADADQLDDLTLDLRDRLSDAWDEDAVTFDSPLEYRVGVDENGDIVGFRYVNDEALTYVDEVPLLDLTVINPDLEAIADNPIGQFKIVFRPSGVIEVSPWYGRPQAE